VQHARAHKPYQKANANAINVGERRRSRPETGGAWRSRHTWARICAAAGLPARAGGVVPWHLARKVTAHCIMYYVHRSGLSAMHGTAWSEMFDRASLAHPLALLPGPACTRAGPCQACITVMIVGRGAMFIARCDPYFHGGVWLGFRGLAHGLGAWLPPRPPRRAAPRSERAAAASSRNCRRTQRIT
jgi:hypothetical protein